MHAFILRCAAATLLGGIAVPAVAETETWVIDPAHTYPSFEFPHMGISVWRGKFSSTSGTITLDREARTGSVDVAIDPDSIDFGADDMHEHARSANWFDVAKFPTATYKGAIRFDGEVPAAVDGELTVRGVTRPLTLTIEHFKCIPHPMSGKQVCGADASGELHWSEFGMYKMDDPEADKVRLSIQVEAQKQG